MRVTVVWGGRTADGLVLQRHAICNSFAACKACWNLNIKLSRGERVASCLFRPEPLLSETSYLPLDVQQGWLLLLCLGRKKRVAYKELLQRQERQEKLASLVQRTAFEKELMVSPCTFHDSYALLSRPYWACGSTLLSHWPLQVSKDPLPWFLAEGL